MDKKEISKAYRIRMQEIRKRHNNKEFITDEEYDKMKRFYDNIKRYNDKLTLEGKRKDYYEKYYKNSESHKRAYKKFYNTLKEIKKRYDNNENITDEEYNKINKYYKLNKKVKPEKIKKVKPEKIKKVKPEKIKKVKPEKIKKVKPEKIKNYYSIMNKEQKEHVKNKSKEYYKKNRDKILENYHRNKTQLKYYHNNKNFIISENIKYRESKRIEDLKKLYHWDKQQYIDTMTLNLGYS